jgi:hypothetical protein
MNEPSWNVIDEFETAIQIKEATSDKLDEYVQAIVMSMSEHLTQSLMEVLEPNNSFSVSFTIAILEDDDATEQGS